LHPASDLLIKRSIGRATRAVRAGACAPVLLHPHIPPGRESHASRSPPFFLIEGEQVAAANWFRFAYLAYASRPKSVRQLFRLVKRHEIRRIVEVGLSDVKRSISLIEVAQRFAGDQKVSHSGLDWFDARPPQMSPLLLKDAYCALHTTGANVRLVPGAPAASLAAIANSHQNTDLILISSAVTNDELASAWFYVPRMLHNRSVVLREELSSTAEPSFEWLSLSQIAEWAGRTRRAA
jgi:hypothetical protein